MEQHKSKLIIDKDNIPTLDLDYLEYFRRALQFTTINYKEDMKRIQNTKFNEVGPYLFMNEISWVILASGFRASVVSKFFDKLMEVLASLFCYAANDISEDTYRIIDKDIKTKALEYINNKRKIDAIFKIAQILRENIQKYGWEQYRNTQLNTPEKLQELPFIGPTTCFHIARNIGILGVVKPDKHLVRMAKHWKFDSARELCQAVKKHYDMELGIIDVVFWYSASQFGTKEIK